MIGRIQEILGADADGLLKHQCKVSKDSLHLPGPDFIDRIHAASNRPIRSLVNLQQLFNSIAGLRYILDYQDSQVLVIDSVHKPLSGAPGIRSQCIRLQYRTSVRQHT